MSNLSNQQINSSFSGLLQVPGGITSTLQTVQDGNGNSTGLSLSTTQAGAITASLFKPSINGTPISGSINRLINDGFGDYISVKDFGATGDGTTDDSGFFTTADAAGYEIFIPKGNYKISSSITLNNLFSFEQGSILIIPNGVTVTFNGGLKANIYQIFNCSGTGNVIINPTHTTIGYPEWWGAQPNNGSFDCSTAINAAIVALSVIQLQRTDYYIASQIVVATNHVTVKGISVRYNGTNKCTRIILTNGTGNVMLVGTISYPAGGINDFIQQIYLEDIELTRTIACVPPAPGNEAAAPKGMALANALYVYMTRIKSSENMIGFYYAGGVAIYQKQCISFRTMVVSPPANDFFWGWYINGNTSLPTAGGNASIYFSECQAGPGGSVNIPIIGMFIASAYSDTFVDRFETANCTYGIYVSGLNGSPSNAKWKAGNVDIFITNPIIDQFIINGITVYSASDYGSITISNPYAAPQSTSTGACIKVQDSGGSTVITGGQFICWGATSSYGISVSNSTGVSTSDNMIVGCYNPIYLSGAKFCTIKDIINNPAEITASAAVTLSSSSNNYIQPAIYSSNVSGTVGTGKFAIGVNLLSTTNTLNEVNWTKIQSSAITGSVLSYNSTAVTATGVFGTNNLASGAK